MRLIMNPEPEEQLGPTGVILYELPSPYVPHPATGLLHLPRFIAKIRYAAKNGGMPKSYRKNFKRGFDRFLCSHLGVEPDQVEELVNTSKSDEELNRRLLDLFPDDLQVNKWNRKLVQMGMSEEGGKFIEKALTEMGIPERVKDIKCVADIIEIDEGRIPGYNPLGGPADQAPE